MGNQRLQVFNADDTHCPTFESRQQVQAMVACGMNEADIASVMDISPAQVMYHYQGELENGLRVTSAQVGAALLKNAMKGDTISQQFWLRNRAGWVPPQKVEVSGRDGKPIEVEMKTKIIDDVMSLVMGGINPKLNDPVPK